MKRIVKVKVNREMKHLLTLLPVLVVSLIAKEKQPNIILMLSDDQHWNETSVQMHPSLKNSKSEFHQTPHLERFAANGMRFSSAYAPAPVCSATRASIQTGLSPATLQWCKASPVITPKQGNFKLLPPKSRRSLEGEELFSTYLQQAGYATAHYGKWHIGGGGPEKNGYDVSDGDIGNEASGQYKDTNPVDIVGMTNRATTFIESAVKADKPFFVQLSYLALHSPENASQKNIRKFTALYPEMRERSIQRLALTSDLDDGVGALLAYLDKAQLTATTYVIYMSDNGANVKEEKVIKGSKGSIYEGGTRAVFIVKGPGVAQNSWSTERIVGFDLFPTFCKLAGVQEALPKKLEGADISGLFHGSKESVKRSQDGILFHFPHYQSASPMSALYYKNYKLVRDYESGSDALYNIEKDIAEAKNIAKQDPEQLKLMQLLLEKQLASTKASLPVPNPEFDVTQPADATSRGKKGKKGKR